MHFKIKKSHIFLILMIFLLLQEFSVMIGNFVIPYYFIVIIFFIIYSIIYHQTLIKNKLIALYKTKIGKSLIFFILWILLSIIISIPYGNFIPTSFLTNFIGNFFCSNLFPFLIPAIFIPYIIGYKKLCKYLLIIYFFLFLAGGIEYIANSLNLTYIQNIFLMFVNRIATKTGIDRVFVEAYGKFRISGLAHNEPGAFAAFIFISSPIIYLLCTSKVKILKNKFTDFFVKTSTLLLAIYCFIGTQSPINLCFMLIFLSIIAIYKFLHAKKYIKILFILSFSFILLILFLWFMNSNIDLSYTYLSRIITTMESFTSMTILVQSEPSLATRIGNYAAAFSIAIKYPIYGIGYGNIMAAWPQEVLSLKIPITTELYLAALQKLPTAVSTMFWKLIAETGFTGMILFYVFLFNILNMAKKANAKYIGFENSFFKSLMLSLILYISVSYYIFLQPFMWIYFGILVSMILNKRNLNFHISNNEENINDKKQS